MTEPLNLRPDHDDLQDAKLRDLQERLDKKAAWGHHMIDQTEAQKEAEIERRAQERVALLLENNSTMPGMIASSVERGFRRVISDAELRAAFWRAGYEEFEKHAGSALAQYIGKKVIQILLAAALAASLTWAVVSGKFK